MMVIPIGKFQYADYVSHHVADPILTIKFYS